MKTFLAAHGFAVPWTRLRLKSNGVDPQLSKLQQDRRWSELQSPHRWNCCSGTGFWADVFHLSEPERKQRNVINSLCSRPSVFLCWHTWQLENDQVAAAFWFLLLSLIQCLTKWHVHALRTFQPGECAFPSSQQVEPASLASGHRLMAISQKPG